MVPTSKSSMKKRTFPLAYCTVAWMLPFVSNMVPRSVQASRLTGVSHPLAMSQPSHWQTRHRQGLSSRGGSSSNNPTLMGADGGSGYYDDGRPQPILNANYPNSNERGAMDESYSEPPVTTSAVDPQQQETVQERLDQWRHVQLENAARMQESPRDAQGRMKLLTSIGKGSRAAIFFFLMWRDVHLYETATAVFANAVLPRLIVTVPLIALFITNMIGAIISLTSPSQATKKRLKAVLNLDKLIEVLLLTYSVVRLTVWPSQYTAREIYIGNCFHAAFFLLQCQAFTRVSWDENSAQPLSTYTANTGAATAIHQPPRPSFQQQQTARYQEMPVRLNDEWSEAPSRPFTSQ